MNKLKSIIYPFIEFCQIQEGLRWIEIVGEILLYGTGSEELKKMHPTSIVACVLVFASIGFATTDVISEYSYEVQKSSS